MRDGHQHLSYEEERGMDQAFEAHQDRLADEAGERDRRGFADGDKVTVGTGKTVWTIDSFTDYRDGIHAHLEATAGYAKNTAHVDRLRAVTP
jgi:hypothetical protein